MLWVRSAQGVDFEDAAGEVGLELDFNADCGGRDGVEADCVGAVDGYRIGLRVRDRLPLVILPGEDFP